MITAVSWVLLTKVVCRFDPFHRTVAVLSKSPKSLPFTVSVNCGPPAEVELGDKPSMHAEVDYGQTRFEIANAIENQTGWSGTAADCTQVALRFERVECIDNMSGEKFEARAVLAALGKEYGGCGRYRSNRS